MSRAERQTPSGAAEELAIRSLSGDLLNYSDEPSRISGRRRHQFRGGLLLILAALIFSAGLLGSSQALADTPPSVTIGTPTDATFTTAEVSGTVNPEGGPSTTNWRFEYSDEPGEFFSWQPAAGASGEISGLEAEGTSPVTVGGTIEALKPNTEYFVRLVAENGGGVVTSEEPDPSITTIPVGPPTVSIQPPTAITGATAHFAGEIDPEGTDPAFDVEWHFECEPECRGMTPETIDADNAGHPVSVDAAGLLPGVHYEVNLVAKNAGGTVVAGPEAFSTATIPPQISDVNAKPLATEARLESDINPGGLPAFYHFEYGPTTNYGNSSATKALPAGGVPVGVSADLTNLVPGTTYHFRLSVETSKGTAESVDQAFITSGLAGGAGSCPNEAFRAQFGLTSLPDCLAYEQVSPIQKDGFDVIDNTSGHTVTVISSPNGETVAYASVGGFPGSQSSVEVQYNLGTRQGETQGWLTASLTPPLESSPSLLNQATLMVSESLDKALVASRTALSPGAVTGQGNLYVEDVDSGTYTLVATSNEWNLFQGAGLAAAATPNLDRIVLSVPNPLIPSAVYEWRAGSGLKLLTDPVTEPEGACLGPCASFPASSHVISADGSRVFLGSPGSGPYGESRIRYLDQATPTELGISQRTGEEGIQKPAEFQAASSDGSIVFFTSTGQLTDDASESGADLYRYDVESGDLIDLTPGGSIGSPSEVQTFYGAFLVGEDGKHAYFVADGALAGAAESGHPNLYEWSEGTAGLSFLGELTELGAGPPPMAVSPSGRFFAFQSTERLPGYENAGHAEVYLFDGATGKVECASCDASGAPASSGARLGGSGYSLTVNNLTQNRNRVVLDDGTVFFTTSEPLIPSEDSNGVDDAYGDRAGRLTLYSDGHGEFPSTFVESDQSGANVFFVTRDRLVTQDQDNLTDLYDARSGGGIWSQNPGSSEAPCVGDSCRPASGPVQMAGSPSSTTYQGPGNLTAPKPRHKKKKPTHHKKSHKHHKKRSRKVHKHRKGKNNTTPEPSNRGRPNHG